MALRLGTGSPWQTKGPNGTDRLTVLLDARNYFSQRVRGAGSDGDRQHDTCECLSPSGWPRTTTQRIVQPVPPLTRESKGVFGIYEDSSLKVGVPRLRL